MEGEEELWWPALILSILDSGKEDWHQGPAETPAGGRNCHVSPVLSQGPKLGKKQVGQVYPESSGITSSIPPTQSIQGNGEMYESSHCLGQGAPGPYFTFPDIHREIL